MIIKSVSGNTLTDEDDDEHEVAVNATITLNSKPAKLADLQPGDTVNLRGDPAHTVAASR